MTLTSISDLPVALLTLTYQQLDRKDQCAFALTCRKFSQVACPIIFRSYSKADWIDTDGVNFIFFNNNRLSMISLAGDPQRFGSETPSEKPCFAKRTDATTLLTVTSQRIQEWKIDKEKLTLQREQPLSKPIKRAIPFNHQLLLIPQSGLSKPQTFSLKTWQVVANSLEKMFVTYWQDPQSLPMLDKGTLTFHPLQQTISWKGQTHPLLVQYPYAVEKKEQSIVIHQVGAVATKTFPCGLLDPKVWMEQDRLYVWEDQELKIWDLKQETRLKTVAVVCQDILAIHAGRLFLKTKEGYALKILPF
ncbi:MAG: F-box protein [Chlamydiia bacterium]|nr:F-box protein [Chlamydiia bacterium]